MGAWTAWSLLLLGWVDAPPTPEVITAAVRRLGDEEFAAREAAMQIVWGFGDEAVAALTAAKDGDDPEIRYRAALLLRKIAMGIQPDMPIDVAQHLEQYRTGDRVAKRHAVVWLEGRGAFALLLRLSKQETDDYVQSQLRDAITRHAQEVAPALILRQRWQDAEELLLAAREIQPPTDTTLSLARFYWSAGKTKEGIARLRSQAGEEVPLRNVSDLAALYALAGKWPEALAHSQRTAVADLRTALLVGSQDWKTLAASPLIMRRDEFSDVRQVSSQVLLHRLAGDQAAAAASLAELVNLRKEPTFIIRNRMCSTRLLILEQFDEAFKSLETDDPTLLAVLRIRRQEYRQLADFLHWNNTPAFDDAWLNSLPTKPELPRETQFDLAILSARALVACGRADDARRILDTLARNPLPDRTRGIQHTLLAYAALEADQWDRFSDYAAIALEELSGNTFWDRLAPQQASTAKLWHTYFEGQDLREKMRLRLTHISAQLSGVRHAPKIGDDEVDLLLGAAVNSLAALPAGSQPVRIKLIGEAALRHGRHELAGDMFKRVAEEDSLSAIYLGDLAAAEKRSEEAAQWYGSAWETSLRKARSVAVKRAPVRVAVPAPVEAEDPFGDAPRGRKRVVEETAPVDEALGDDRAALPTVVRDRNALLALYLCGVHTPGKEGEQLRRSALGLAPSAELYLGLADGLQQRGYRKDARAIHELVSCIAPLGSSPHATAISHLAGLAGRTESDPDRVAQRWEQARVMTLLAGATFTLPDSYCDLPRSKHLARARAALSAEPYSEDEFQDALQGIERASPGDMRAYEVLLPLLNEQRRTAVAEKLFEQNYVVYRRLVDEYPNSSHFANQLAWLCAISHQKLAEAQALAEQAVKLGPEQPAYIDTLAEVHFQRGDRQKAVELSRRAVELAPRSAEMKRRLQHFEKDEP